MSGATDVSPQHRAAQYLDTAMRRPKPGYEWAPDKDAPRHYGREASGVDDVCDQVRAGKGELFLDRYVSRGGLWQKMTADRIFMTSRFRRARKSGRGVESVR
jgi:hypothetical protein